MCWCEAHCKMGTVRISSSGSLQDGHGEDIEQWLAEELVQPAPLLDAHHGDAHLWRK